MLLRKVGKLILGQATPFQIMAAAVIGGAMGFMPGLQAAGTIFLLILILIMLNANLFVAAAVGVLAKLVSWLILPVSFQVGQVLLDGPTEGLFRVLINAPVTALLGLEYYVVTGGLVLGVVFGLAAGWILVRGLVTFRRRMAGLEENSERYKKFMAKWWTGPLMFLLFGAKPSRKKTYRAMLDRRVGMPIRPLGIALAVLSIVAAVLLAQFASDDIVTAALQRGLERANGATVDIGSAELDLANNRLTVHNLAMADPNDLDTDLLRAELVEADIGGLELLRKRLVLDRVVISKARHGAKRTVRGVHIGPPPEPQSGSFEFPDAKDLGEYFRTAKEWKERLAQIREWLDVLSAGPDDEDAADRRARDLGYARVRADHLIEGRPIFLVRDLDVRGIITDRLAEGETFDVRGQNLSSQPWLQMEAPHVDVTSSRQTLSAVISLAGVTKADGVNEASFNLRNLAVDDMAGQWGADAPITGGTMDAEGRIAFSSGVAGAIDFPLLITLHNTTLQIAGNQQAVEEFSLPLAIKGALDNPQIGVDADMLTDALVAAGANELANEARRRLDEELGNITENIGGDIGKKAGETLKNLLGDD